MLEIDPGVISDPDTQQLFSQRRLLRKKLVELPEAIEGDSATWFPRVARTLLTERRNLANYPEEIRGYIGPLIERGITHLKTEAVSHKGIDKTTLTDDYRGLRAETIIMDLSREMAADFAPELEPVVEHFIPMEQLLEGNSDIFRTHKILKDGELLTMLDVKHPNSGEWHSVPLPLSDKMWYKGGFARTVLKAYVGADYGNELPLNDLDVVFVGDEQVAREQARIMGVDPDGVESVGIDSTSLDFTEYCHGRDITMNQISFGLDGLHFSDKALESAQTGYIELIGEYMTNRAIFGVDKFQFDGAELIKPRGAMRFAKTITEGKAKSINYPEINRILGLGVYNLALAKRWSQKSNFGDRMQALFYLSKEMGLVAEGETDIYTMLRDAHAKYPFFNIDAKIEDMPGVARWKMGKLIKQVDREFAWTFRVPSLINIPRCEGDSNPKMITMGDFIPDPTVSLEFVDRWPAFVDECRLRTTDFRVTCNGNKYKKYFIESDIQTPPESSDEE